MVEQKQFRDKDTEKVWNRTFVKKWSKETEQIGFQVKLAIFCR